MDKVSRSILGRQVSTSRDVGPCILTVRMAFDKFKEFPRPHELTGGKEPLNKVDWLEGAGNMPGKWQLLIYLGQQTILKQQGEVHICS